MIDAANPFHRASFFLEELKYGVGPRVVKGLTRDVHAAQFEVLLRAAGVTSMTGADVVAAFDHYAESFATKLGVPEWLARSIFADGVAHGIAFATGLATGLGGDA